MRYKFFTTKRKKIVYSCLLLIPVILTGMPKVPAVHWKEVDTGLYVASIDSPLKSPIGDSKITVLKINPRYYHFKLISAKEKNESNKTAKEWAKSRDLAAVINAGMFQQDYKTNVGFMKNYDFINILLQLPLSIYNAMYLEGGPEASFYLNHNGVEIQRFGSYETGFNLDDGNSSYWPIPNVIGIQKKPCGAGA